MDAERIVLEFADHLVVGLSAIQTRSAGAGRLAIGQPLTFESANGDRARELVLPAIGLARLHGRGCAIEFDSGADVDFDWDPEQRVVFDGWRLRLFARSIGAVDVTQDQLVEAARLDVRFVETEQGWFTLRLLLARD